MAASAPPFDTVQIPADRISAALNAVPRPDHLPLLIDAYAPGDLAEAGQGPDPATLIAAAEKLDLDAWLSRRFTEARQVDPVLADMFTASLGPVPETDPPEASDAAREIYRRRRAAMARPDSEKSPEERELEAVIRDMEATRANPDASLDAVISQIERLHAIDSGAIDPFQSMHIVSQFFGGDMLAAMPSDTDEAPPEQEEGGTPPDPISAALGPGATEGTIAHLPTTLPWATPAWMHHATWAEPQSHIALLALCRRLFERHGARPICATVDTLGFALARPLEDAGLAGWIAHAFHTLGATEINGAAAAEAEAAIAGQSTWVVWWD